jgi:hypothetical protein
MLHTYKCFNIILYSHSITYNNHSTYSCTLQLWDWDIELDTNPQALDVQLIIFYSVTTRVEMLQSAQQCQNWPWIGQTTTSHITSLGLSPSQPKPTEWARLSILTAQAHQSPAQPSTSLVVNDDDNNNSKQMLAHSLRPCLGSIWMNFWSCR